MTDAFEARILTNLPRLEGFVRVNLGPGIRSREETQDIVQSVCREVLEGRPQFRDQGEAAFVAWMFRHAITKIRERVRRGQAQKRGSGQAAVSLEPDQHLVELASILTPSRVAMGREETALLEDLLFALPEDQRHAITLHRLASLEYPAVAAALGRSEVAVRKLVSRGLARLSSLMTDRASGSDRP